MHALFTKSKYDVFNMVVRNTATNRLLPLTLTVCANDSSASLFDVLSNKKIHIHMEKVANSFFSLLSHHFSIQKLVVQKHSDKNRFVKEISIRQ